ncbi:MAG: type II toxin-antitoxin system HipA family toxin [Gemmatimonadota bacterium]
MADGHGIRAEAEVRLWGETVGALVELESGRVLFEYADEFRHRALEISPFYLPSDRRGPQSFEELLRKPAFQGLPGVLADALPDAFGRRVIRAYYEARGQGEKALSPVQRLLYVGERALGALSFHPAEELPIREAETTSLEVQRLAEDARSIVQGAPGVAIPEIYRIGSSAGGQRPKAIVHSDPESGAIRSGGTPLEPGEVPCILKFDGVGTDGGPGHLGAPQPYNRVEAAYGDMARAAGVDMAEIDVLETDGYAHLLVRRFDIVDGDRLHQHTFGGLRHVDYNDPGASSYEEYFRTIQQLGMAYDALTEGYRRMVFNVMAINQDDHVKNLSFHMDRGGTWSLTPAYDVTFAAGEGWTRSHQMRIRDKTSGIREDDLLALAREFGVKRPDRILDETRGAIADWERYAEKYEVPDDTRSAIRVELDRRASSLAGVHGANQTE